MLELSRTLFLVSFAAYLLGSVAYISGVVGVRMAARVKSASLAPGPGTVALPAERKTMDRWPVWGMYLVAAGVLLHAGGIVARWLGAGYWPISNMYEFMNFFGFGIMVMFLWINRQYRVPALGAVMAPVGMLILAYASIFPRDVQPLIPALQSYWLVLHVSVAALGEAAFAVSFGAGLMYLLRAQNTEEFGKWGGRLLEFTLYCLVALAGFVGMALLFKARGYQVPLPDGSYYSLPPLIGPSGFQGELTRFAGLPLPLFETPAWMAGVNAAQKWNTIVLSLVLGALVYAVLRLAVRMPLRERIGRWLSHLDLDVLDDISYKGVAVGFPLFTLGGLLFAMIWAQQAWGRFWGWDPKEVWALITWLVYSGYLHLRMTRGWRGAKAAWLTVMGFVVVLFTLLGVNLLIVGLHSYAV